MTIINSSKKKKKSSVIMCESFTALFTFLIIQSVILSSVFITLLSRSLTVVFHCCFLCF